MQTHKRYQETLIPFTSSSTVDSQDLKVSITDGLLPIYYHYKINDSLCIYV